MAGNRQDMGASSGSHASHRTACGVDGPAGFDPAREQLVHRVIMAIASASVPHKSSLPGALESRSLSYYLGVGIDYFGHDFDRHETLLRKAAENAINSISHGASGTPHGRVSTTSAGGTEARNPANAIATETQSAETTQIGSVEDEGAGRNGIAQPGPAETNHG